MLPPRAAPPLPPALLESCVRGRAVRGPAPGYVRPAPAVVARQGPLVMGTPGARVGAMGGRPESCSTPCMVPSFPPQELPVRPARDRLCSLLPQGMGGAGVKMGVDGGPVPGSPLALCGVSPCTAGS